MAPMLTAPANPYRKDAEAAGRIVASWLRTNRKREWDDVEINAIYQTARWAAHWANLALQLDAKQA